jgi:DNA-binding NarL/FixJ family response regulator
LAGIEAAKVSMFTAALETIGGSEIPTVAPLEVPELGKREPDLLICDLDASAVDGLELLRRLRFVLPECLIVVYTGDGHRAWGVACHLAGASCILWKSSTDVDIVHGIRHAIRSGCYTDPRMVA